MVSEYSEEHELYGQQELPVRFLLQNDSLSNWPQGRHLRVSLWQLLSYPVAPDSDVY